MTDTRSNFNKKAINIKLMALFLEAINNLNYELTLFYDE